MLFSETALAIESAEQADDVWEIAVDAISSVGLPIVIYMTVGEDRRGLRLRTNVREIYDSYDTSNSPFLNYCCKSYDVTPTGAAFLGMHDYLSSKDRELILRAQDFGFRSGVGIPIRLEGTGRFGGFNLGCSLERDTFERDIMPIVPDLRFLSFVTHRRLTDLDPFVPHEILDVLTPREREIAQLVARGMSRKKCAHELSLSPHTLNDHLKSVYRKLEVHNRVELSHVLNGGRESA